MLFYFLSSSGKHGGLTVMLLSVLLCFFLIWRAHMLSRFRENILVYLANQFKPTVQPSKAKQSCVTRGQEKIFAVFVLFEKCIN